MAGQDDQDAERTERLRRRLKAAREIAGLTALELAERLPWGKTSISNMETGKRPILDHEVRSLAHACGVPPLFFFSVDFSELQEPDLRDELADLRQQISGLRAAVAEVTAGVAQNARAMREHRVEGHPKQDPQGGAQ